MKRSTGEQNQDLNPLFTKAEWNDLAAALRLSERERQILESMCNGLKDESTATQLGLSTSTIRSHVNRMHRKLGVTSRAKLLVHVFKAHRRMERADPQRLRQGAVNQTAVAGLGTAL